MTRYHSINGELVQFTPEEEAARDAEEQAWADGQADRDLAALRAERNRLLAETDFYGNSDVTMTAGMKTYRQKLRDITKTATSLEDVTWPTKP